MKFHNNIFSYIPWKNEFILVYTGVNFFDWSTQSAFESCRLIVGCRFDLTSYQAHLESTQDPTDEQPGKKQEIPELIADELVLKKNEKKA